MCCVSPKVSIAHRTMDPGLCSFLLYCPSVIPTTEPSTVSRSSSRQMLVWFLSLTLQAIGDNHFWGWPRFALVSVRTRQCCYSCCDFLPIPSEGTVVSVALTTFLRTWGSFSSLHILATVSPLLNTEAVAGCYFWLFLSSHYTSLSTNFYWYSELIKNLNT